MPRPLSDIEALMWGLESNPHLASTTGSIAVLEHGPDPERLRNTMAAAVAALEPLHERVVSSSLPLAEPEWRLDTQFDLDHHLRFVRLSAPATFDELFAFATRTVNDPFDRTRPLWQMTLVTGLPRGRAALITKAHHSIADGQGLLRLALQLFDLEADAPPRAPTDLDALLRERSTEIGRDSEALAGSIRNRVERLLTLAVGAMATPNRAAATIGELTATARMLTGEGDDRRSVSPLWSTRSRNRRSIHLVASLPDLRTASATYGATVNDLFVVACAEAALGYHARHDVDLPHLAASVVISTRRDDDPDAHNAFVPAAIVVPGSASSTPERLAAVADQVRERRQAVADRQTGIDTASQIASLLPSSVTAATALDQAHRLDFATSNLPGPPVPLWLAGVRVESIHPLGPVAGTAFNATLLSFLDDASIGLHIDPTAVADAPLLAEELRSSLARLHVPSRSRATRSR